MRNEFNLNLVLADCIKQSGPETPNNIEVRVELGNPLPYLIGDESRTKEAFANILRNAIESMPDGGTISCHTTSLMTRDSIRSQPGAAGLTQYVRLRISDTGEGMDTETRANMFTPFFTTKSGMGRGLGATLAHETVRSHGGFINVSSMPGTGTQIDLYFSTPEDACATPNPIEASPVGDDGLTLLIVDDDDMVRLAIQRMLAHLGYRSLVASTGEEALEIYERHGTGIAAVILDITMPGMGGIETFNRLRQLDSQVKIIISSGDPTNPAIRDLKDQGVSFMLAKPFHSEQLARAIQQILE